MTLILDHLTVAHKDQTLVALNVTVRPGAPLVLMGASGSGKSTALAAIIGALDPAFRQSGTVILDGKDLGGLPPHARRIGLLYQDALLFPHLSVGQNLAFGLAPGGSGARRRAIVTQALIDVDLPDFADRDPATLSGGQRARVALMRCLLAQPLALLLDEPFTGLDADLRGQIRDLVFAKTQSLPVILVTHDRQDASAAGGPVLTPLGQPVIL